MTAAQKFYESGYRTTESGREILVGFAALPAWCRVGRAAEFLGHADGPFLDIGCGPGSLLHRVSGRFSGLHGVDFAESQLERARRWSAEVGADVTLTRVDIDNEPLPYADGTFAAVASLVVLEFVFSPERLVSEAARVLKPGGHFVVTVGNIASIRNRVKLLFGKLPGSTEFGGVVNGGALHIYNVATLKALLVSKGFVVERHGCSGRFCGVRSWMPALLGGDILLVARKLP